MPATVSIRVATRALRGSAAAATLWALYCTPAQALSFNWSFRVTEASPDIYLNQTISGTIDNLQNNANNENGMTATILGSPFWPPSTITLTYAGGSGIDVNNGVVDTSRLQAFFVYQGQYRLLLQNTSVPYGDALYESFADSYRTSYNSGNGDAGGSLEQYYPSQYSASAAQTPTFSSPAPAPLPLLGLGAAIAFSRQLKQRIAMRRKRVLAGDKV